MVEAILHHVRIGGSMDINDIARKAGVSRATVSRYLNDGYVSKEKRELIGRIIEETGYVPSHQAQTLRTGKTKLIGVVIPKINSHSVGRMVAGITSMLAAHGYQVLLATTDNDESREVEYLSIFSERNQVDGVILIATVFTPAHRQAIEALSIPIVVLGQQFKDMSCVYQDDYHALYEIARSCLEKARKPVYIGVREGDVAAGMMRRTAFADACADAGIELDDDAFETGEFTTDSGYLCTERLLESNPDLDTIICANDDMAFGSLTCLREYGRRVPEDVQVTGVGDGSLASISYPALTTVHFFYRTSGEEAARMLVSLIEEGEKVSKQLLMGYEIMIRASTR